MTSEVMVSVTSSRHNHGMKKLLPLAVLVLFSLLSVELAVSSGLHGLVALGEPAALQVALDLVIATFFVGAWIRRDARRHGIAALPFLVLLPLAGSIAALAYVVRRDFFGKPREREAELPASAHPST